VPDAAFHPVACYLILKSSRVIGRTRRCGSCDQDSSHVQLKRAAIVDGLAAAQTRSNLVSEAGVGATTASAVAHAEAGAAQAAHADAAKVLAAALAIEDEELYGRRPGEPSVQDGGVSRAHRPILAERLPAVGKKSAIPELIAALVGNDPAARDAAGRSLDTRRPPHIPCHRNGRISSTYHPRERPGRNRFPRSPAM